MRPDARSETALRAIRSLHTIVWAFFAGCIVAIPVAAHADRFDEAAMLIAIVLVEVVVILANRWRCPLTDVAARYTDDRAANFDIYLPRWLARWNKELFGTLFVLGVAYTWIRWTGRA
jgi:hypothetical protein